MCSKSWNIKEMQTQPEVPLAQQAASIRVKITTQAINHSQAAPIS
jgi:hypothetical protein